MPSGIRRQSESGSALTPHGARDWDLRLDPPLNRRIPIARNRFKKSPKSSAFNSIVK
jgi:hypothetical protein